MERLIQKVIDNKGKKVGKFKLPSLLSTSMREQRNLPLVPDLPKRKMPAEDPILIREEANKSKKNEAEEEKNVDVQPKKKERGLVERMHGEKMRMEEAGKHPPISNLQNKPLELKKNVQKAPELPQKKEESPELKPKIEEINASPAMSSEKEANSPPKSEEQIGNNNQGQSPQIDFLEDNPKEEKQGSTSSPENEQKSGKKEDEDPLNQIILEDNEDNNKQAEGENKIVGQPEGQDGDEGKKQDSLDYDQLDKVVQEDNGQPKLQKVFIPETNQELYMDEDGNVYDMQMNCIGKIEEEGDDEEEAENAEEMEMEEQNSQQESGEKQNKIGRNAQQFLDSPENEAYHSK